MLKVNHISFDYGEKKIVKDISFSVEKGKFLSIIGPNGSGKTTLLNILTGHLKKKEGKVKFLDKEMEKYSVEEISKHFAVISQNTSIRFPFTALEIVMMGRNPFKERMKNLNKKEMEKIYHVMEITDTLKFANSLITQVSGGEFQRIILARALVQNPKVLFLDEAFSAMDIAHRIKALRLIKSLVEKENLTVISILHDLNLAYTFSDKVCVLKEGKLEGIGNPQEVMTPSLMDEIFGIKVQKVENKGFLILA